MFSQWYHVRPKTIGHSVPKHDVRVAESMGCGAPELDRGLVLRLGSMGHSDSGSWKQEVALGWGPALSCEEVAMD